MRSYLLFLVLLLLSGCVLFSRINQFQVEAPTNYPIHNLNTGLNYTTIQEAINANETTDGNTILVDAGIYYEAVTVNKSLSLVGADRNNTILDGNFTTYALLNITASNTKIRNFTITGSEFGVFLINDILNRMLNISNVEVSNNIFTQNIDCVEAGSNCRIADNFMENDTVCIDTEFGNNITVVGNTLINSGYALQFAQAGHVLPIIAWSNNFINNSLQIWTYDSLTNLNIDYPVGGNYWSNYTGTDKYSGPYQNESGSDGIGDTPYIPDHITPTGAYPVDYYPLMHPIPEFPSFLILPLFFITTLLATIFLRKRLIRS